MAGGLRPGGGAPLRRSGSAAGEGPGPGAETGLAGLGRADPGLHGRRPVHRPRRPVAARRAADVRALRPGHRVAAAPRLAGGARAQAGAGLALLQPAPAGGARRRLQRRPVRLQGHPRRRRRRGAAARGGPVMVLRHRAARPRRAVRPAHPRGAGGLVRRPRLARRRRQHGPRRPARRAPAAPLAGLGSPAGRGDRRADGARTGWHRAHRAGAAVRGCRGGEHRRCTSGSSRPCAPRSGRRSGPTSSRSCWPPWPTPP